MSGPDQFLNNRTTNKSRCTCYKDSHVIFSLFCPTECDPKVYLRSTEFNLTAKGRIVYNQKSSFVYQESKWIRFLKSLVS